MRVFLVMLSALLLTAAPAAASDPLLSGYAGPGGGDQQVLGTDVITPSGPERPLARPAAPAAASTSTSSSAAPTPSSSASTSTSSSAPPRRRSAPRRRDRAPSAGKSAGGTAVPTAPERAATPVVAAAETGAGGLPVDGGDALLVALAVLVLAGVAVVTTRLAGRRAGAS